MADDLLGEHEGVIETVEHLQQPDALQHGGKTPLVADLVAAYLARIGEAEVSPEAPAVQFADFALWQEEMATTQEQLKQTAPGVVPSIQHYLEFRNRFHFGHIPKARPLFMPLNSKYAIRALTSLPQDVRRRFYFDVMESLAPEGTEEFIMFTGAGSEHNIRTYERAGYDVEYLCQVFGVGYESVASRLSTLQRDNLRGIPFTFVRVDRAGNMSKRQSATGVHFSNNGGTCPLWNVYETFTQPGIISRQLAQMPDGRNYLWISRAVQHHQGRFGDTNKLFAIGLGCEARHADRTVYAEGLDLKDLSSATPIGSGCRTCPRENCAQRAFPPINEVINVDAHRSAVAPY